MLEILTKLAAEHKEKSHLMSIIIFKLTHANVIEALRKQTYVDAIDELTGKSICVFWAALPEVRVTLPTSSPGEFSYMVPVYREPSTNKELFEMFGIKDSRSLPLLITFAFDERESLYFRQHPIDDTSVDSAFTSIRKILEEKANLLSGFDHLIVTDKRKMFSELDLFDAVNNGANIFSRIIEIIATLRSSSGL